MNRKLAEMMVSWFPSPPTYTYKRKTKTTVNWKLGNRILHYSSENVICDLKHKTFFALFCDILAHCGARKTRRRAVRGSGEKFF